MVAAKGQCGTCAGPAVAIERGSHMPHLILCPGPGAQRWVATSGLLARPRGVGGRIELRTVALQGLQHAGRHPETLPFAILSPQKPLRSEFFDRDVAAHIVALIDDYIASLGLDRRRVYLTGLSQGGIGTWGIASDPQHAARFAAVAPVCGGFVRGNKQRHAEAMADTPVWAFHGANDSILPVALSDESVAALQRASGPATPARPSTLAWSRRAAVTTMGRRRGPSHGGPRELVDASTRPAFVSARCRHCTSGCSATRVRLMRRSRRIHGRRLRTPMREQDGDCASSRA